MVRRDKWGFAGLGLALGLCAAGWPGCAAGGGGGDGGTGNGSVPETGGSLDVNFGGAAGGNFAVAEDEDGNEYTFRRNDAGEIVEANVLIDNTGQTMKVSLDDQGRPVKLRASDGTNADLIYDSDRVRIRFTDANGATVDKSGINPTSARARIQQRRSGKVKQQVAMQADENLNRLRVDLKPLQEVVESIFDEKDNPDTPLKGTTLEEPARRIARIVDLDQVQAVTREQLPGVELDQVPSAISLLANQVFLLFEAEGYCVDELGSVGDAGTQSRLNFDANGVLVAENDRNLLFDLGLGGVNRDVEINWAGNTPVNPLVGTDAEFDVLVTPVFTGTQLDDDGLITVERRFLAVFTFPEVEAFTTSELRSEQLFSAAFVKGAMIDGVLEFDLVLIDLDNDAEPRPVARLRYHNQLADPPPDRQFPCGLATGTGDEAGSALECPDRVDTFQEFIAEFIDRDTNRARRLEYVWNVTNGYGYVTDDTRFSPVANVVPTGAGLLEVSLVASDPDVDEEFDVYQCQVAVGEIGVIDFIDCPRELSVGVPDNFFAGSDVGEAAAGGPRQLNGDSEFLLEWVVVGTSEVDISDPFALQTDITFHAPGVWEVWFSILQPDGSDALASCAVTVNQAGFDECAEFGWYGDGICDDFCPLPDPDCEGDLEDICAENGWYGDGVCDNFCPLPDPDCESDLQDICELNGWYGDGEFCDDFCPLPDPDCDDICEVNGWYGDRECDTFCPLPDPDCDDECVVNGWYDDGECDAFCPLPDPDCTIFDCFVDSDCGVGELCLSGVCVFVGGGGP